MWLNKVSLELAGVFIALVYGRQESGGGKLAWGSIVVG